MAPVLESEAEAARTVVLDGADVYGDRVGPRALHVKRVPAVICQPRRESRLYIVKPRFITSRRNLGVACSPWTGAQRWLQMWLQMSALPCLQPVVRKGDVRRVYKVLQERVPAVPVGKGAACGPSKSFA